MRDALRFAFTLGIAVACNPGVDDDELEAPPDVPPRAMAPASPAEEPFVPAGNTWISLHGIRLPLLNDVDGMPMVDYLDVGNEAAEAAHQYFARGPARRIERDFVVPRQNAAYREDGRAQRTAETFVIQVAPEQDNFLVKGYDSVAADQKVRVRVGGARAGEWSAPSGGSNRYGEAVFPLRAGLVGQRTRLRIELEYVTGDPETNAFVYWVFAKPTRKLREPLHTHVERLWMTDHLDVGNDADERDHDYVIDAPTFGGNQQFEWPDSGEAFVEDGRATGSYESFEVAVIPGRDHLLVKAFDTYSRNQVLRVWVERRLVGEWTLPDGAARYGEGAFRIPADSIGARSKVTIRIEVVSASIAANSFQYWMYAEPPDQHG